MLSPNAFVDPRQQRWPWWPLLPLYPYGQRPTLVRELVPGRVWGFEQLHGVWYVAVPIRMSVLKVQGGLMLYSPVCPTAELLASLRELERQHGPVLSIVLATSSGLEHKLPTPALCRAFPSATLWVSDRQWSFPVNLPSGWLGFPSKRTRVLGRDGWPHSDQLEWFPLGPINLGLGCFLEIACLDCASGCLLLTDALIAIAAEPPPIFELDPTPLLFHARDYGSQPLIDSFEHRIRGWKRILLFANYFSPEVVSIPPFSAVWSEIQQASPREARTHFGLFPFRWSMQWELQADALIASCQGDFTFMLAPVLERLVFVRSQPILLEWLRQLAAHSGIRIMIPAHYHAPVSISSDSLAAFASLLSERPWASSGGSWQLLASIDSLLMRMGVVPSQPQP